MKRRHLLFGAAACYSSGKLLFPDVSGNVWAQQSETPLYIPELLEINDQQIGAIEATASDHDFGIGQNSSALGFSSTYLGPTIRVKRGQTANVDISNRLGFDITAHWHGLHIDGKYDGGPHSPVKPGETFRAKLDIDQPASTLWYHSHIHMQTGVQVYAGLAGMMIIDDPSAPESGLPSTYGVDDIPLIIQDKVIDSTGQQTYSLNMPTTMHGFRGETILVNGKISPTATVPKGLVRCRLLNASNARIYDFAFEDRRTFYQVASDGGLLKKPVALRSLKLAPAERVEVVVDFSNGNPARLLSKPDNNAMMGGMGRGRGMGMGRMGAFLGSNTQNGYEVDTSQDFEIMTFLVNSSSVSPVQALPSFLAGAPNKPNWGRPIRTREFSLDMGMGSLGINGKSMSMGRIDHRVKRFEPEIWRVTSSEMAHPFHLHGASFQVISMNGNPVDFETQGLKDVILVDGTAELLVYFTKQASAQTPYMFHCHILEHEDAGMMGQFTVS